MEKILIVGCSKTMDDICIGCSRCLVGFNRKQGAFEAYQGKDVELIGLLGCGDCPGQGVVVRLAQFKLWNAPMEEKPTAIHVAPCIVQHCPHKDTLIKKIEAKAGVPVVEGTHPYLPADIFA
ncbi:MAG: CGGC domain-containing protein [Desulfovibrio sp.]|nr:MAG: CGGC domain-containing protein [Desulfovibrio sp.]